MADASRGSRPSRKKIAKPGLPPKAEPLPDETRQRIEGAVAKAIHDAGLSVSPEKEQQLAQAVAVTAVQVAYQGPLPPPELLQGFNQVVPGLGREIADSAWLEQDHRHTWELRALWNDIFTQSGGLFLGWLLAGVCVVLYFYLILNHYSAWAAAPLLGPPVLAMIRSMLPHSENQLVAEERDGISPSGPKSED